MVAKMAGLLVVLFAGLSMAGCISSSGQDQSLHSLTGMSRRVMFENVTLPLPADAVPELIAIVEDPGQTDRWANAIALLGYSGDERAVPVLVAMLGERFKGRTLGYKEASALYVSIDALGMLASDSDQALAFLEKGLDPAYWQKNCGWQRESRGEDTASDVAELFPGLCLVAIATSGRRDQEWMLGLTTKAPDFWRDRFCTVYDAGLQMWWVDRHGREDMLWSWRTRSVLRLHRWSEFAESAEAQALIEGMVADEEHKEWLRNAYRKSAKDKLVMGPNW